MLITAKYAATCATCRQPIRPGQQIEWAKGSPARHTTCGTTSAAADAPAARSALPSVTDAPYERREKWEACKRVHLADATGETRRVGAKRCAELRRGATAAALVEGQTLVVVAQRAVYESAKDNEDMGDLSGPGWHVTLYLRLATAAEQATDDARDAAARTAARAVEARRMCLAALERVSSAPGAECVSDTGTLPSAAETVARYDVPRGRDRGSSNEPIYVLTATTIVRHHGGYYDDYRSVTTTIPRNGNDLLAAVIHALAADDAATLAVCSDALAIGRTTLVQS